MSKRVIPLVDLSAYTQGDEASRKDFVDKLGKAFHEVGFVGVTNHGVPKQLIEDFYAAAKAFFALPVEIKRKYEIPEMSGQRGYTSFGKEHAKQSEVVEALGSPCRFAGSLDGREDRGKCKAYKHEAG